MSHSSKHPDLIALIVWCLMVFGVQSVPGGNFPTEPFVHFDKVMHLSLYIPMGYLATRFRYHSPITVVPIWAIAFTASFGLADEIHQVWIPQRSASLSDWVADLVGGVIGSYMFLFQHRIPGLKKINNLVELYLIKYKE